MAESIFHGGLVRVRTERIFYWLPSAVEDRKCLLFVASVGVDGKLVLLVAQRVKGAG